MQYTKAAVNDNDGCVYFLATDGNVYGTPMMADGTFNPAPTEDDGDRFRVTMDDCAYPDDADERAHFEWLAGWCESTFGVRPR